MFCSLPLCRNLSVFLLVRLELNTGICSQWIVDGYYSILLASASMKLESNVCGKPQAQFGKSWMEKWSPGSPVWPAGSFSVCPARFTSLLSLLGGPWLCHSPPVGLSFRAYRFFCLECLSSILCLANSWPLRSSLTFASSLVSFLLSLRRLALSPRFP